MRFAVSLLVFLSTLSAPVGAQTKRKGLDHNGDALPEGAIARLGSVRFQPLNPYAVLSPDGTTLASVNNRYDNDKNINHLTLECMDSSSGKTIRSLNLSGVDGDLKQFTPDGVGVVLQSWGEITILDKSTGKISLTFKSEHARNGPIAISADGKLLAIQKFQWIADCPIGVFELATGKELLTLPGRGADCIGLAISPSGKRLVFWSRLPDAIGKGSMSFSGKSKVVVASLDVENRKFIGQIELNGGHSVALNSDGETVAIENPDHIRVLHLPTNTERCSIKLDKAKFSFTPDGMRLLTIDRHGWLALWDARNGEKIRDLDGAAMNEDCRIAGVSRDGKTVVMIDGGWNSAPTAVVWNAETGQRRSRLIGHEATVTCISYVADGKTLVSGSLDRTVRHWDTVTGEHLRKIADHADKITAVAVSPKADLVASSSADGAILVSSLGEEKTIKTFRGRPKGATVLAFSSDGSFLYSGGKGPELVGWEIATGKESVRLATAQDGVAMDLAGGGAATLIANHVRDLGKPEQLELWGLRSKEPTRCFPIGDDPNGTVSCASAIFSPNGQMLATSQISEYQGVRPSYGSARVRLWEQVSGQEISMISPAITSNLAFSSNSRFLASGGVGSPGHLRVGYGSGVDI